MTIIKKLIGHRLTFFEKTPRYDHQPSLSKQVGLKTTNASFCFRYSNIHAVGRLTISHERRIAFLRFVKLLNGIFTFGIAS